MKEELKKELQEIFKDPMFDWVNEESVKKMSEVVRDALPGVTSLEEIDYYLKRYWEKDDTPETLYSKLKAL